MNGDWWEIPSRVSTNDTKGNTTCGNIESDVDGQAQPRDTLDK
jgi:hypothetical protein